MNRSTFNSWLPQFKKTNIVDNSNRLINLNFGPQHPAAHGVLRLLISADGEIVKRADSHVGLLHRGSEKLIEDKIYLHSLPYFDRFDYVSMMAQEHAYCLAIEALLGTLNYSAIFTQVRTLFDELTRILNHMLAISCHALDVGSMSPVFWAFEEREKIMEFYERVSGARMHAAFYRPNEVHTQAISVFLLEDIIEFARNCFKTLNEMHNVLTYNKIWKQRLVGIGTYGVQACFKHGLTGVMARCTGIKRDLRLSKHETYANYAHLNFRGYVSNHGDSYDRYLLRMNEMTESLLIINQSVSLLNLYPHKKTKKTQLINLISAIATSTERDKAQYTDMETLIHHFKYWSEGFPVASGWTYQAVESPKGEFGVTLISDNTAKPYKCKVRSPAYHHLAFLPNLAIGHLITDLSTLIGTVDIVFGEIDR